MVGTVGKGDPVVMISDTCSMLPYARGNARLATLEWTNEVAKAARGTTSVAAIEPPVHAPPRVRPCDRPGHQRTLVDHYPFQIIGYGRRHEHEPEATAHKLVAASCCSEGPDAFLTDHRRGQRPARIQPHPRDHKQAGRNGGHGEGDQRGLHEIVEHALQA